MSDRQAMAVDARALVERLARDETATLEPPVPYTNGRHTAPRPSRPLEPIPPELAMFLTHRLGVVREARAHSEIAAPASLGDAVLLPEPAWPLHLALTFLHQLAELLDAAEAVGVQLAPFSPRCIAFAGPYLDVVPDPDPLGVDPAYVAPEQREPMARVDGRASQYGLATLAMFILRMDASVGDGAAGWRDGSAGVLRALGGARRPTIPPAAVRVLHSARSADPALRFSRARDFMLALSAAFGEFGAPAARTAPAEASMRWMEPATSPVAGSRRRVVWIGSLVGLAAVVGGGAGALSARRSADAASSERGPASARPAAVDAGGGAASAATPRGDGTVLDAVARWASTDGADASARRPAAPPVTDRERDGGDGEARPRASTGDRRAEPTEREPRLPSPPALSLTRLQTLANVVTVPTGDRDGELRRRLVDTAAFQAGGLDARGGGRPATDSQAAGRGGAAATPESEGATPVQAGVLRYPAALLAGRVTGEVVARFTVDTAGRVDAKSFEVVRSTHGAFTQEVRRSLPTLRYRPAQRGGQRIRQTVVQTFEFTPPN